jgi:hypothetical protein
LHPQVPFTPNGRDANGNSFFSSDDHRKIALYMSLGRYSDFSDNVGHGTHTAATLAGVK